MSLHDSTFQYLKPTDAQMSVMQDAREVTAEYANKLNNLLPDGPDKTYIMRELRTLAMWVNITITRHADGSPRT